MSNEFYVGIKTPKMLRKVLLTSSKDILEILMNSQNLIELRKEKLFVMDVLGQELAELQLLLEKLHEKIPEELLDEAPVQPVVPKHLKHKKKDEHELPELELANEPSSAMEELQKIEQSLADVEEKLKYLD